MAKGPFMEYLRADILMKAANSFTQVTIPTPTSKTETMALLIHSVEFEASRAIDTTPADNDAVMMQIADASQIDAIYLSDKDCLARYSTIYSLGAVTTVLHEKQAPKTTFDPPLLCAKANVYFGMKSAGMTAALYGYVRIGYTLEKVSREDFISALVE